jgi:hypothetical protein
VILTKLVFDPALSEPPLILNLLSKRALRAAVASKSVKYGSLRAGVQIYI